MARKWLVIVFADVILISAVMFWWFTRPDFLPDSNQFSQTGDVERGKQVFNIAGCASCHAAEGAKGEDLLVLSGGQSFPSPFGTFYAPNISPDPNNGIGGWSTYDLANALVRGVSPDGQHYYPAFPYASYTGIELSDVIDLKSYLDTLPKSGATNKSHDLPLLFRFRRGLGLWKLLFIPDGPIVKVSAELARGQYLVEVLGHCGECHTPRNLLGGMKSSRWLAGAPNPEGKGTIPNITPHADGLGSWSAGDIEYYLESGFTPDFDSAGGLMGEVIDNTSLLSKEDRAAIAAYLIHVPAEKTN